MCRILEKKKLLIPVIFLLLFSSTMFSGCIFSESPIGGQAEYIPQIHSILLRGTFVPCEANNHSFVYDTEKHENWEDYKTIIKEDIIVAGKTFTLKIPDSEFESGIEYHFRAVAYCYDFWGFGANKWEDGWYQSFDMIVVID